MTIFIPKWILWTIGVVIGVPVAAILLAALVYGLMLLWVVVVNQE